MCVSLVTQLYYCIKVSRLLAEICRGLDSVLVTAAVQFQSGSRHVTGVGGLCRSFHESSFRHLGEMAHHFPSVPISIA